MAFVRWLRVGVLLPSSFALLSACGSEDDDEVQQTPSEERPGPAGCYIEAEFRCDCELDEAACTDDVGMWVPKGCGSCAT